MKNCRIIEKVYWSEDRPFFLVQLWERNCFKRWLTVYVASSHERAALWWEEHAKEF